MRSKGLILILYLILILGNIGYVARAETLSYNEDWDYGVVVVLYGSQYGTGFWVSKGWRVTAGHVVSWKTYAKVQIFHGDFEASGTVVYVDQVHDVAVIKADSTPARVHFFKISSSIEKGMRIYVIGYPYELYALYGDVRKMSANPRGAEGMITWVDESRNLAEIQATIDQGNSGGPVVDSSGNVVGLVSFAIQGEVGTLYFISTCDAIRSALQKAGASYQLGASLPLASESSNTQALVLGGLAGFFASLILFMVMKGGRKWSRR